MTPSYIFIDTPDSPIPRYALYLYREQGWDNGQDVGEPGVNDSDHSTPVSLPYLYPEMLGHINRVVRLLRLSLGSFTDTPGAMRQT